MFMHPVPGPITSPYGPRRIGFHNGQDYGWLLADPDGSKLIYAPATGTVTVGRNALVGNYVLIASRGVTIRLAHLASVRVKTGQIVTQGQTLIGVMGNTGAQSLGVHLHVDVYKGSTRVNPAPYFTVPFQVKPSTPLEITVAKNFVDQDSYKGGKPVDGTRCLTLWEGGRVEVYTRAPGKPGDAMAVEMSQAFGAHQEVPKSVFDTLATESGIDIKLPTGFVGQFN
jgi:hypothetical protein